MHHVCTQTHKQAPKMKLATNIMFYYQSLQLPKQVKENEKDNKNVILQKFIILIQVKVLLKS